jgi:hypothetical protein
VRAIALPANPRTVALGAGAGARCDFSPAGDALVCVVLGAGLADPGRLLAIDLTTLSVRELAKDIELPLLGPLPFSPEGTAVVAAQRHGTRSTLQLVPLDGSEPIDLYSDDRYTVAILVPIAWLR